jgi:hypothetical protein
MIKLGKNSPLTFIRNILETPLKIFLKEALVVKKSVKKAIRRVL